MSDESEVWRQRLAAIEAEGITAKAYAEREGLSVLTLYAWRQRLKQSARRVARHHWVEVCKAERSAVAQVAGTPCTLWLAHGTRLEFAGVPAPAWIAALAVALGEGHG